MKKIIKLTESDLSRIVKRAISEQSMADYEEEEDYTPTLKEKIESVIRDSVTSREEVIQVLEDILRERRSGEKIRNRFRN